MKLFSAAALVAATAAICPSTQCWTLNTAQNKCTLKDACVSVTCGPTSMTMLIDGEVFGANVGDIPGLSDIDEFGISDNIWVKTCDLGNADCLTPTLAGDKLTFMGSLQQVGSSRTRSVADTIIDLGDFNVVTSPFGVGVDFTCSYDSTVIITSGDFTVQDVSVTGTQTGSGDLATGFTLTAGSGTKIVLGEVINVAASWSMSISGIEPYFKTCFIRQMGDKIVFVMKEGCHSTVLGIEASPTTNANSVTFSYRTFMIEDEAGNTQSVTCEVQLCPTGNNCARDLKACPNSGADKNYGYTKMN